MKLYSTEDALEKFKIHPGPKQDDELEEEPPEENMWLDYTKECLEDIIREDYHGAKNLLKKIYSSDIAPKVYGLTKKEPSPHDLEKSRFVLIEPYPAGYEHLATQAGHPPFMMNKTYLDNLQLELENRTYGPKRRRNPKVQHEFLVTRRTLAEKIHASLESAQGEYEVDIVLCVLKEELDLLISKINAEIAREQRIIALNYDRLERVEQFLNNPFVRSRLMLSPELVARLTNLTEEYRVTKLLPFDGKETLDKLDSSLRGNGYTFPRDADRVADLYNSRQKPLYQEWLKSEECLRRKAVEASLFIRVEIRAAVEAELALLEDSDARRFIRTLAQNAGIL